MRKRFDSSSRHVEIMLAIAGAVFLSACYSIAKDLPQARRNMCERGKRKCLTCYDRFRCWTNK